MTMIMITTAFSRSRKFISVVTDLFTLVIMIDKALFYRVLSDHSTLTFRRNWIRPVSIYQTCFMPATRRKHPRYLSALVNGKIRENRCHVTCLRLTTSANYVRNLWNMFSPLPPCEHVVEIIISWLPLYRSSAVLATTWRKSGIRLQVARLCLSRASRDSHSLSLPLFLSLFLNITD